MEEATIRQRARLL